MSKKLEKFCAKCKGWILIERDKAINNIVQHVKFFTNNFKTCTDRALLQLCPVEYESRRCRGCTAGALLLARHAMAAIATMAAMPLSENEVRARSWHLSAQICLESNPVSNHIEFVRGRICACLPNMQKKIKKHAELTVTLFITPIHALDRRNLPVCVILYCWRTIGYSTVEALLNCLRNDSIKFTVTSCTPLDVGPDTRCLDFTSTPLFIDFIRMSSKDTGPDVDPICFLRVDVEGDSDAHQATVASNEHRCRSWTFNASFDLFLNPDLVDSSAEVAENIVHATLDQSYYQTVGRKADSAEAGEAPRRRRRRRRAPLAWRRRRRRRRPRRLRRKCARIFPC